MFAFKFDKAVQAVAYLLNRESCQEMNYMRLIKILYISDRNSIRHSGIPISGGRIIAMKQGPVPSELLDLIKGFHLRSQDWEKFIKRDEYKIRLIGNPGRANLTRSDIEILEATALKHRSDNEWEMVELTHEFSEWKKNEPVDTQSNPIPFSDILEALGRSDDLQDIQDDANVDRAFTQLFGS